ncbi:hypothetical protein Ahy_A09g046243 [Arachis hypogaea]|uniref:PB1 domain-containing protein n=1 Tax=Arachis hypogaea TaxID=3818 RepID=A0A445BP88_ARAHY|nr:hypothetical protein Ahy_A09g046243 [Arachis hypogaea]
MASENSFLVLVHHRGSIKRKTRSGVKFTDKDPLCIIVSPTTSYDALVSSVLAKFGLEGVKRVKKFFYRIPTAVLHDTVKYDCFTIGSDEDLQLGWFEQERQHYSHGGSSSRPAVASSSVPVYEPAIQAVASPSFAVDLSGNVGDEVRYGEHLATELRCPTPAGVGEGLFDDPDDDDVESDMIADNSGDDLGTSDPRRATGGSISGTQQYPPHFSSNCNGSANFTTCLLATRHMHRYSHASAADPQLNCNGPANFTTCLLATRHMHRYSHAKTTNLVVDHPGDMSNSIQPVKPPRIVPHRLNMPLRYYSARILVVLSGIWWGLRMTK